jgi:membrane-bound serine protease (ClpP class)
MALMMLIMFLPVIGLVLFYVWPLSSALPTYLVLLFFSGIFHVLMRKSMKLPVATGASELIGLPVSVLSWKGPSGQVRVHGEVWEANTGDGKSLEDDEELVVAGIQGLTLIVEPRSGAQPAEDS